MREIKFRMFDKTKQEMYQAGTGYVFNVLRDIEVFQTEKDHLLFMQYTGLKDCHGKEIYEGDIIKNSCDHFIANGYIGKVYWDNEYSGFTLFSDRCTSPLPHYDSSVYYTVIGNIYENPELLINEQLLINQQLYEVEKQLLWLDTDIKNFTENKEEVKPFNPLECGFDKINIEGSQHETWLKSINDKLYQIVHTCDDIYLISAFDEESGVFEKDLIERIKIPNHQFGVDLLRNLGVIE